LIADVDGDGFDDLVLEFRGDAVGGAKTAGSFPSGQRMVGAPERSGPNEARRPF